MINTLPTNKRKRCNSSLSLSNKFIYIFACINIYVLLSSLSFHEYMVTKETTISNNADVSSSSRSIIKKPNSPISIDDLLSSNKEESLSILINHIKEIITNNKTEITTKEMDRCEQYGFEHNPKQKTRRIFFGSLIADDSWNTILTHAIEAYGLYHHLVFIESNTTLSGYDGHNRKIRFAPNSTNLNVLQNSRLFGPHTTVTLDYYIHRPELVSRYNGLEVEILQREMISQIWKDNGMTPHDIGIISDIDEFFTRDFLLAAKTCNIPEFDPNTQNCKSPKILATTMIFESSPECIVADRIWYHPDMILGKCIDKIGDSNVHKPGLRLWNGLGPRLVGHGLHGDFSEMHNITNNYPLWTPEDIRTNAGGRMVSGKNIPHTGYHLHNFFNTVQEWKNKYATYGHPLDKAMQKPLDQIHEDVTLAVNCAMDRPDDPDMEHPNFPDRPMRRIQGGFYNIVGPSPIAFQIDEFRRARQKELRKMVTKDELDIMESEISNSNQTK